MMLSTQVYDGNDHGRHGDADGSRGDILHTWSLYMTILVEYKNSLTIFGAFHHKFQHTYTNKIHRKNKSVVCLAYNTLSRNTQVALLLWSTKKQKYCFGQYVGLSMDS